MKKGIAAINAQIDSVTAYRERERRRPRYMSIQEERRIRQDDDEDAIAEYRERQAERLGEPYGFCE